MEHKKTALFENKAVFVFLSEHPTSILDYSTEAGFFKSIEK